MRNNIDYDPGPFDSCESEEQDCNNIKIDRSKTFVLAEAVIDNLSLINPDFLDKFIKIFSEVVLYNCIDGSNLKKKKAILDNLSKKELEHLLIDLYHATGYGLLAKIPQELKTWNINDINSIKNISPNNEQNKSEETFLRAVEYSTNLIMSLSEQSIRKFCIWIIKRPEQILEKRILQQREKIISVCDSEEFSGDILSRKIFFGEKHEQNVLLHENLTADFYLKRGVFNTNSLLETVSILNNDKQLGNFELFLAMIRANKHINNFFGEFYQKLLIQSNLRERFPLSRRAEVKFDKGLAKQIIDLNLEEEEKENINMQELFTSIFLSLMKRETIENNSFSEEEIGRLSTREFIDQIYRIFNNINFSDTDEEFKNYTYNFNKFFENIDVNREESDEESIVLDNNSKIILDIRNWLKENVPDSHLNEILSLSKKDNIYLININHDSVNIVIQRKNNIILDLDVKYDENHDVSSILVKYLSKIYNKYSKESYLKPKLDILIKKEENTVLYEEKSPLIIKRLKTFISFILDNFSDGTKEIWDKFAKEHGIDSNERLELFINLIVDELIDLHNILFASNFKGSLTEVRELSKRFSFSNFYNGEIDEINSRNSHSADIQYNTSLLFDLVPNKSVDYSKLIYSLLSSTGYWSPDFDNGSKELDSGDKITLVDDPEFFFFEEEKKEEASSQVMETWNKYLGFIMSGDFDEEFIKKEFEFFNEENVEKIKEEINIKNLKIDLIEFTFRLNDNYDLINDLDFNFVEELLEMDPSFKEKLSKKYEKNLLELISYIEKDFDVLIKESNGQDSMFYDFYYFISFFKKFDLVDIDGNDKFLDLNNNIRDNYFNIENIISNASSDIVKKSKKTADCISYKANYLIIDAETIIDKKRKIMFALHFKKFFESSEKFSDKEVKEIEGFYKENSEFFKELLSSMFKNEQIAPFIIKSVERGLFIKSHLLQKLFLEVFKNYDLSTETSTTNDSRQAEEQSVIVELDEVLNKKKKVDTLKFLYYNLKDGYVTNNGYSLVSLSKLKYIEGILAFLGVLNFVANQEFNWAEKNDSEKEELARKLIEIDPDFYNAVKERIKHSIMMRENIININSSGKKFNIIDFLRGLK